MTLNPENLAVIASAYVAAIGLIAWQSPARLFDSLALDVFGQLGSLYLNQNPAPRPAVWP